MKIFLLFLTILSFNLFAEAPRPVYGAESWRFPVKNFASLPASGNKVGDCVTLRTTGALYCWGGASWSAIGSGAWGTISGTLSDQTDLQAALDAKVNNTGDETIAGVKTFSSAPILSALTASRAVVTDGSKVLASLQYTNANTASTIVQRDASGNFSAGTISAALTGNASTATALASNPTDCGVGEFANAIAANGNLTCATPTAAVAWGAITGTLSSQSDLNTALGLKAPIASPTHTGVVTVAAGSDGAPGLVGAGSTTGFKLDATQINASVSGVNRFNVAASALSYLGDSSAFTQLENGAISISEASQGTRYWRIGGGNNSGVNSRVFGIRPQGSGMASQVQLFMGRDNGVTIGGYAGNVSQAPGFGVTVLPDFTDVDSTLRTSANASTTLTGTSSGDFRQFFGEGDYVSLSSAASTWARVTAVASGSITTNIALGNGSANQSYNRKTAPMIVFDSSLTNVKLYVDAFGSVVIGGPQTAALSTSATDGFLYVPTCAGTPSGTPRTHTGTVPIVVDTTAHKAYFYDNSTWNALN